MCAMSKDCGEHAQELDMRLFDANEASRLAGIDKRLYDADRLAKLEAEVAAHASTFKEREKAEIQAQTERQLAAAAVQTALQEAATASAKALEAAAKAQQEALQAALKNANELELERVARVEDQVKNVKTNMLDKIQESKEAASLALTASEKAIIESARTSKETLDHHNELLKQMNAKDATYQTKDTTQIMKDVIDKRHVVDLDRVIKEISDVRENVGQGGAEKHVKEKINANMLLYAAAISAVVSVIVRLAGG